MKEIKIIETSLNPVTFRKQTKIKTAFIDPNKNYEADFLEWKAKILSNVSASEVDKSNS